MALAPIGTPATPGFMRCEKAYERRFEIPRIWDSAGRRLATVLHHGLKLPGMLKIHFGLLLVPISPVLDHVGLRKSRSGS